MSRNVLRHRGTIVVKYLVNFFALMLCTILASGCLVALGAGAGAGGVVYYKGNLKDTLGYTVPQVHEAAMKAVGEEGLPIYEESYDDYNGHIRSEYPDGKNVWITLEAVGRTSTHLKIRVGAAGDQKRANTLFQNIQANLH
jgi:hypothetical protein